MKGTSEFNHKKNQIVLRKNVNEPTNSRTNDSKDEENRKSNKDVTKKYME